MAAPEGRKPVKPFKPPSWMRDGALKAVAQMDQQEMAERLRKAADDAKDNQAAFQILEKLIPAQERSIATQPSTFQQPQINEHVEATTQQQQQQQVEQPESPLQMEVAPRVLEVQNRDERRLKKATGRKDQTVSRKVKKSNTSSIPSPTNGTTSSSMAESSTFRATESIEVDSSASLFIPEAQDGYPVATVLPDWYTSITEASFGMRQLTKKGAPAALRDLDNLKLSIGKCEAQGSPASALYDELRNHIHKAEIESKVDQYIIKKARILAAEVGLPRIFREGSNFPWDLKADAFQLYNRWMMKDFDHDLLRGIVTNKGEKRNGDALRSDRIENHRKSAKYYGAGDLVIGQWWPTQLSALRDGAHGATQGGIFGEPGKGAYSIVLSGCGSYDDTDDGDTIEYSGTAGKNDELTAATLNMIQSVELGNPIRVIRSAQLPMKNLFRPTVGLRYDGLYVALSYELVDGKTQMHRFRLRRCGNQDPIRCGKGSTSRPTREEERAFAALKLRLWR